ncbi:lysophospholipid acyltransferase family protein [bacterium]|nr:lysophospholipid acyltransferase family protein [bacterium]
MIIRDWKRIRHRIEYTFLLVIVLYVWMVSFKTVLLIADVLGYFVFSVLRIRRKVVMDNLMHSFPEKSKKELLGIARRTYQNFAKMIFEYIRFPLMKKEDVLSICSVEGMEHVDWALKKGKGAVIIAGHFGNWELMGAYLAQLGYQLFFLVGEQHNKMVDDMMNHYRRIMGIHIIHMGVAVRGVIKALRNNQFVALLSDQNAGQEGVFVEFLGRQASTPQGPAIFVLKTGAPILFSYPVRLPHGKQRIFCERLCFDHLHGISPENIREVTQAYTRLLEKAIRAHPDHWFWMHRRWKSHPYGEGGNRLR